MDMFGVVYPNVSSLSSNIVIVWLNYRTNKNISLNCISIVKYDKHKSCFFMFFSARAYRAASLALGSTGQQEQCTLLDILMQNDAEGEGRSPQQLLQSHTQSLTDGDFQQALCFPKFNFSKVSRIFRATGCS